MWRRNHAAGRWDCDPNFTAFPATLPPPPPKAAPQPAAVAQAAHSLEAALSAPLATPPASPSRAAAATANGITGAAAPEAELSATAYEQRLRACMVQVRWQHFKFDCRLALFAELTSIVNKGC